MVNHVDARAARVSSPLLPSSGPEASAPFTSKNPPPKEVIEGLKAVIQSCRLIIDAIRAAGPAGVPSGHLYARLMGQLSLEEYQRLMEIVKGTGLINERNNVLTFDEEIIRAGRHEH